jgi:hypothetical protein
MLVGTSSPVQYLSWNEKNSFKKITPNKTMMAESLLSSAIIVVSLVIVPGLPPDTHVVHTSFNLMGISFSTLHAPSQIHEIEAEMSIRSKNTRSPSFILRYYQWNERLAIYMLLQFCIFGCPDVVGVTSV